MRPRRLELEGFSTFRERACLDFDGLDLVAFTGPTGAGKSTLIDAITFALYGSVSRYENANRVAPVIHQLANEARVRLDFETGGRTYIATRVVRRKSVKRGEADQASTREARLELAVTGDPDGETTVLAGDVKELNAAVEDLLGLDFKQFTRTIVLPQGDFAAFLRDDPATREKLLQRLLDLGIYERMGQLARSEAKRAGSQIEILVDQLRRVPAPSDEELIRLVDRVDELDRSRSLADAKLASLVELDARLEPLRAKVNEIDLAIERLAPVELPDLLPGLDRKLQLVSKRRQELEASLAASRRGRDGALAELERLPDRVESVRALTMIEQIEESRSKIEVRKSEAVELAETSAALSAEQETVEALLLAAEAEMRSARRDSDAADWTAALVAGEPCPVCHRLVDTVPDHDGAHRLEEAEQEHRRLEGEAKSLAKRLAEADGTSQVCLDEIERLGERVDLLQLQLSAYEGSRDPVELQRRIEAVDVAERRHREASAAAAEAEVALQRAIDGENEIQQTLRVMRTELAALRDSLADLQPPSLTHESLVEDYDRIQRWAKDRSAQLSETREALAIEGKRTATERGRLMDELTELASAVGIGPEPSLMVAALADASAEARVAVAAAEQRRADNAALSVRIEALQQEQRLNETLGRHLRSGGFGSWLLSEALENIVAKATIWLLGLSNDQYSLVAGDKNFAIIDHNNANETRDVRTLSGGETFLASLALALALADSIAELAPVDAPRLESMFLDEGFGTLDPGTLDVVAGAIEELASTGRMIGIVTHVSDLAERMPARFEVTKGPLTSSVELVEL